jgi:hypothetical protein
VSPQVKVSELMSLRRVRLIEPGRLSLQGDWLAHNALLVVGRVALAEPDAR